MDRALTWEDKIGQNSLSREFTKKVGKNDLHSNMCSNSTLEGVKTRRYKIFRESVSQVRGLSRGLIRESESKFHLGRSVQGFDADRKFVWAGSMAGARRTKFWVGLSMCRNTLEVFGDPQNLPTCSLREHV